MKIVGVAACTVGIAHTYMAQKAIQDECAARGIECKVEAQGGLGIENELTQEDVDSADLVLESVDVGVENEDRFEQKMAEGKFLKVGTSDVIADPVKIIDQAVEIIKATGGAVDAPKAEAKAEKKAVSAAPQAPTPASKQSIFADPGKTLLNAFNTGVSYFIPIVVIGGVFLAFSLASGTAGANGMEVTNPLMVSLNTIGMAGISMMIPVLAAYIAYSMAGKPALAPGFVLGYFTRWTEQVGHYNFKNARELADMAKRYGVGLKEHNADYLDDATLLEHIPAHVTASNVAPQYGTEETRAYLKLCATEQILVDNGLCDDPSDLYHTLLVKAIKTERWRKWMTGDDVNLQVDDILADDELSLKILDVSGHYAFNDPEVKEQVEKLYRNLAAQDIDGKRVVIEHIKRPIKQYVVGLNLKGVTSRIEKALED